MKRKRSLSKTYKSRYSSYKRSNAPSIYPNPYQSSLIYFNYLQVHTEGINTGADFIGAYELQNFAALVNLRPYWGQYRVEKLTVRLQFAELPNITSVHMATCHSADGATFAAHTPTLQSIRSYQDYQAFQVNQNTPKKVWRFNTNDPEEYTWVDIPAAVINNDTQFLKGGVQYFIAQTADARNSTSITMSAQFKVRLFGKQAIAI